MARAMKHKASKTMKTPAAQAASVITIKNFMFSGPSSVSPGAKVMVKNEDGTNHTVTATGAGGFDVTVIAGKTATFVAPAKAGSYPYVCTFHSDMTGTLVVK
jgi:plastocyanin